MRPVSHQSRTPPGAMFHGLALAFALLAAGGLVGGCPAPGSEPSPPDEVEPAGTLADRLARGEAAALAELVSLVEAQVGADSGAASGPNEETAGSHLALARRVSADLSARPGDWNRERAARLAAVFVVDPVRFRRDADFRDAVWPVLLQGPGVLLDRERRGLLLSAVQGVLGLPYEPYDDLRSSWGLAPRRSAERRLEGELGSLALPAPFAPIRASVYSLPSYAIGGSQAVALISAVRKGAPDRRIVVLSDDSTRTALEAAAVPGTAILDTFGFGFSPWPRDVLTFARDTTGPVMVLRPNRQAGRERDSLLGRELLAGLPDSVDTELGAPRWVVAPTAFHNGHLLPGPPSPSEDQQGVADGAVTWASIHSFEVRALEILGAAAVPVERFGERRGIDEYLAAVRRAARELEELHGREVRFVHPMPDELPLDDARRLLQVLGGGAPFDLDTLVTFPRPGQVLVGSLSEGDRLLATASIEDFEGLASALSLVPASRLALALRRSGTERPFASLERFLDLLADSLGAVGFQVTRLPLIGVPPEVAVVPSGAEGPPPFLLSWNNVVLEGGAAGFRAEGFAMGFGVGDRLAVEVFRRVGVSLELLPTFPWSIRQGGGYRCASNHLR